MSWILLIAAYIAYKILKGFYEWEGPQPSLMMTYEQCHQGIDTQKAREQHYAELEALKAQFSQENVAKSNGF